MSYELHPLCTFFPRIEGKEFEKLKEDIKTNGQIMPIILYNGMILDGGHRYRALSELEITPYFEEYTGNDPIGFVNSANLFRRHLTQGQAAAIIALQADWGSVQKVGRPAPAPAPTDEMHQNNSAILPNLNGAVLHQNSTGIITPQTTSDRAKMAGVSIRTQGAADALARSAPEAAKAVASGAISLNQAANAVNGKKIIHKLAESEKSIAVNQPPAIHPPPSPEQNSNALVNALLCKIEELEHQLSLYDEMESVIKADDKIAESMRIIASQKEEIRVLNARLKTKQEDLNKANSELFFLRKKLSK